MLKTGAGAVIATLRKQLRVSDQWEEGSRYRSRRYKNTRTRRRDEEGVERIKGQIQI